MGDVPTGRIEAVERVEGGEEPRARAVLARLAVGALWLATVVGASDLLGGRLVVVGDTVLRAGPTGGILLAASAALGLARLALGRAHGTGHARSGRRGHGRVALPALAALVTTGVALLLGATSTDHVLTPASPDGCRVVVEERAFLLAGSGTVHVLPRYAVLTRPVGRYDADDGYEPVAAGAWSLTWRGDVGTLHLTGSPGSPVWPADIEVSCPG